MADRPVLLDLYCGAGGAAMGYHRAGWDVIGVDIRRQPDYPFPFQQRDALTIDPAFIGSGRFAAVHASPPCQHFTRGARRAGTTDRHPNLIPPTRVLVAAAGIPYVIENVDEARSELVDPIMLCGHMFGLGVFRHRWFELPWWSGPTRPHRPHTGRVGDGQFFTVAGHCGGRSTRDGHRLGSLEDWQRAMGIDWMSTRRLAQAIPPAFTEYVGRRLLAHVNQRAAVSA